MRSQTLYRLIDGSGFTGHNHRKLRWGKNVTHRAVGEHGGKLCTASWIHAYVSREQAEMMFPAHLGISAKDWPLWEARGVVRVGDGTKVGCRRLTTIRRVKRLRLTADQRAAVAILYVAQVYQDPAWVTWAVGWLSGEDRSPEAARVAADAADAAHAAAYAAYAAGAASVINVAAGATGAAAYVANVATYVANVATSAFGGAWMEYYMDSVTVDAASAAADAVVDAASGIDITATVRAVLDTPEGRWADLLETKG